MTLNEIAKKLIRQNKGRYLILSLSICFAILMTGAYGVLLFSPAITDVLMTDGSTYLIALIPYAGNELYAARQWDFYPYAKATQLDILLESGSVYLLLIFFIAIIAFVSASMIMCLKIAGTILQDQESYQRAVYLGLKERDLKKMIRKQIALIYFFPTFCGSITAIFMINRFMAVSSVTHISAITVLAVLLSVVVVIIQIIAFGVLQRRMTAVATKAVYEKNY